MKWTKEQYDTYQKRIATNQASHERQPSPKPEQIVRDEPMGKEEAEGQYTRRRVSITSHRVRLLDPDNLCIKYHVDGLRYAGVIRDDTTNDIELFVKQHKVATRKEEKTEIEVT